MKENKKNEENGKVILEKTNLDFESRGVLNPAFIEADGFGHMFYRAIGVNNISSIGYCRLEDDCVKNRMDKPILKPEYDYEKCGLEDPRIVRFGDMFYLFYTAFDGVNAMIAYATSKDLVKFIKHGPISPNIKYSDAGNYFGGLTNEEKYRQFAARYLQSYGEEVLLWEKDAFIFPRKISGRFALIHRVLPGIQVIYFDDFKDLTRNYWLEYFSNFHESIILEPYYAEESWLGGGSPPIETTDGWLLIYHTVEATENGNIYHASAALLDLENPRRVIGRLRHPLFSPTEAWEMNGTVNNVVFPTGTHVQGNKLRIYYGAADRSIAVRSFDLKKLIRKLKSSPNEWQKNNQTKIG